MFYHCHFLSVVSVTRGRERGHFSIKIMSPLVAKNTQSLLKNLYVQFLSGDIVQTLFECVGYRSLVKNTEPERLKVE